MINWRGVLVVLGGVLVHLTLGTIYTYGNMAPYLTSYIRARSYPPTLRYTDSIWVFALAGAGQGATVFLGGLIDKKIGPRFTTLIGAWIMSAGVLLTGVAVKTSFALTIITYGIVFGLGVGIAYGCPMACAMKWMPEHKGLVNGCILAGFGGGAFIFNQIQTAYINPENLSPNNESLTVPSEKYFSQDELLNNVPSCFYLLGGIYAGIQFFACLFLAHPAGEESDIPLMDETTTIARSEKILCVSNYHPSEVIKTKQFYMLWLIAFFNLQVVCFISTLYKTYGQTFIFDDHFLSLVGSFGAVGNALGRILWGHLMDRSCFRTAMLILCTSMIALMMTLVITEHAGRAMFFIWICLIFLTFCGNFSLLPTVTAKMYGPQYFVINYGLLFTANVATAPVGAYLASALTNIIGWFGMFSMMAGFSFIALVITFFFDVKVPTVKETKDIS